MTGKRFINDIDIGQLIDTKGELSTIDYSDKVDFYELWEFLNKLNDENEQLKTKVDFYKYFQKDARELEKENEQLKQRLESKEKAHTRCDELYWELYEEKEQLKNICKNLINEINNKGITVTMSDNVKELLE